MGRYDLPDPKCRHKRKGIVKAGSWEGAHASHAVCDRPACIEDALEWARTLTRLDAVFIPDRPALIDGTGVPQGKGESLDG